ncbi:MAG: hypothetical protein DKT66_08565 [Candidatus Melainabacteria bacterium]|nr:MAG: hypothetical protein DKT66_08565 [Candidatus Melainabacteria bacterium]
MRSTDSPDLQQSDDAQSTAATVHGEASKLLPSLEERSQHARLQKESVAGLASEGQTVDRAEQVGESPSKVSNVGTSVAEPLAKGEDQGSRGGTKDAAKDGAKGGDRDAAKDGVKDGNASCPVSTEYNTLIDKAWRNIYDPTPLGDLASLKNKYNCQIKTPEDAFRFVNQELGKTDDHFSRVLNPAQVRQFDNLLKGSSKGIGIEVVPVDPEKAKEFGSLKVIEVIPGSSAAQKGVQRGDYISAVDGVDLKTKTPEEAFALIQSQKTHQITVFRNGEKLELSLPQTTVDVPAVVDRVIPGTNIAYIRVRDFMQDDESYELQNAIKRHPYVDGFVFDVRGNLGGSVLQALQSASMVVGEGTLLTQKMRHEDDSPTGPATYDNTDYTLDQYELVTRTIMPDGKVSEIRDLRLPDIVDKPTVVLVNKDTASAAEIFAAALQQTNEATLVGTQTFGKGIGQTVFYKQPAGSRLQVTNFRFYTPNGDWIGDANKNRIGVKPNQVVENGKFAEPETSTDLQFQAAIATINRQLGRRSLPQNEPRR